MELIYLKDLIVLGFVVVAVWFSHRKGWKTGLEDGVEESLLYLEDKGFIRLVRLEDGDYEIYSKDER